MRNLKCTVAYDGTNYHGFQKQENAITVQEVIETSLEKLIKKEVEIIGASRTDSGVHAEGQVFNCKLKTSIPTEKFALALNTRLPDDIVIIKANDVNYDFHARYSSKDKIYRYQIYNDQFLSPFLRNYTYHIYNKLDLKAMKKGASYLVGKHDFTSFRAVGCNAKVPIRTIYYIDIDSVDKLISLRIKGSGFLYNMVRIIVGTLIKVGLKRINPTEVKEILLAKDRRLAGPTAFAGGLILEKIIY